MPTTPQSTPAFTAPDPVAWFAGAPTPYLVLTPELVIAGVNDAYLSATGTTRDQIVGRPLFEVFPDNPDDPAADGVRNLRASLERVLSHHHIDRMPVQKYDIPIAGGGFEIRYWNPQNTPILGPHGEVRWILHHVEDVTPLVRLGLPVTVPEIEAYAKQKEAALASTEEQLRQAQKLEAVGRLAGGIAHDFNNLLTIILTAAEFLHADLPPEGRAREDLREIERAGQRAADLTRRLLAFSRQQVLDPRIIEPAAVVRGLQSMLTRLLGEDIEIRFRIDQAAGNVKADWSQLEQVVLNLVVNARDAMPSGGHLGIEVAPVMLDDTYSETHHQVPPGPYVLICVSDTGEGMSPETQRQAYEPFFTTKPVGQGTGLGLSTVFGIVKQSGGFIWLYSEVGVGTTFKIYLPRVEAVATQTGKTDPGEVRGGSETILVMEDDLAVRSAVVRILARLGYDVIGAQSPEEVLGRCTDRATTPDLLLTDLVMPRMSGRQLADAAGAAAPGLKVLFMSGYTADIVTQQGILTEGMPYISKPITIEGLGRKVRETLDGV